MVERNEIKVAKVLFKGHWHALSLPAPRLSQMHWQLPLSFPSKARLQRGTTGTSRVPAATSPASHRQQCADLLSPEGGRERQRQAAPWETPCIIANKQA